MSPSSPESCCRKCEDLDEKRIQKYAGKMDSGRWKWNDTPIVLAEDGTLLKGRHRLWGVFEASIPVEFLVAYEAAKYLRLFPYTQPSEAIACTGM